jgi:SAM-dependent methyltransferase
MNMDPLAGSQWSAPGTVAGFSESPPNQTLIRYAYGERLRGKERALDVGCGAARNAVPLAQLGWDVIAVDLSWPMLRAAVERATAEELPCRPAFVLAPMDALPAATNSVDLVVAHGIWNLARSAAEFRGAVREAARVSRPGAGLFVFTFSRNTLPPDIQSVPGEPFVFTEFSGQPQCFLTETQLLEELGNAGFVPDDAVPLVEHNRPRAGSVGAGRVPVIYEGTFRYYD